jgi:hypothetical protein
MMELKRDGETDFVLLDYLGHQRIVMVVIVYLSLLMELAKSSELEEVK